VPEAPVELDDLVDLKLLPAWIHEPPPRQRYAEHEGEQERDRRGRDRRDKKGQRRTPNFQRPTPRPEERARTGEAPPRDRFRQRKREHRRDHHPKGRHRRGVNHHAAPERPLPKVEVKFLPRPAAFENVVEQIKSGMVGYSLFAMARLFLEKPTRYQVKLTAPAESPLFQLGDRGAISSDRDFLERSAFRFARSDYYKVAVTETEPIRGNFTNVARCRLSGTVLGPTNHHDYQRRLRNLYEQRFSRRMNFPEYRHKIEIVSDPSVVEKWKDDARRRTTFTTVRDEPVQTFPSEADAERHFQQHHFEGLIQSVVEATIAIVQIADRALRRVVEEAWTRETKSPSQMMQELATRFRESGLHIFRHRRGMLFVSPIYPRAIAPEAEVSPQVRSILEAIAAQARIGRKELADKLLVHLSGDDAERGKLALASDLKWLIDEGHVIEFNEGSLDLPRVKAKPKEQAAEMPEKSEAVMAADVLADEFSKQALGPSASTTETVEIGGS
jgi:hypothetical protein